MENKVGWRDKVKIETSEMTGEGIVTKFHNDKHNGVEIEIIFLSRKSDNKQAKPGRKINFYQSDLTVIQKYSPKPQKIEDDDLMKELFESETKREEAIPVITPEFCGKWR